MRARPLRSWLAVSHLLVLVLPLVVLLSSGTLGRDLREQTQDDLEHQGTLLALWLAHEVREARAASPDAGVSCCAPALSSALGAARDATLAGYRITDAAGLVVASSGADLGEDLSDRAEVRAAIEGHHATAVRPRPAPSTRQPLSGPSRRARVRVHQALPVVVDGQVLGAVVVTRTPREEMQTLYQMAPAAAFSAVLALVATLALAWAAGVLGTRSLMSLDVGARRIVAGDLGGLDDLRRPQDSHVAEVSRVAGSVSSMAVRLRERLSYIGEFASNVSHEFKTPLATLRGTVELLGDEPDMAAPQRERFLANAEHELGRLERMVTGLLSLARAEEDPVAADVALGDLLERCAGDAEVRGRAGGVRGDASQLEAVVRNLLDNARRHGAKRVTLEGFVATHTTGFSVIDDGPGISAANLPRVFERFFTTDREQGGTGLGLALVRAICQRHGGDVSVQSTPGRTVFRVELPLSAASGLPS